MHTPHYTHHVISHQYSRASKLNLFLIRQDETTQHRDNTIRDNAIYCFINTRIGFLQCITRVTYFKNPTTPSPSLAAETTSSIS